MLAHSISCNPRSLIHEMVLPTNHVSIPMLMKSIQIILHKRVQKPFSQMILYFIMLILNDTRLHQKHMMHKSNSGEKCKKIFCFVLKTTKVGELESTNEKKNLSAHQSYWHIRTFSPVKMVEGKKTS